jgi:ABC-type transport system involved in multi-copper enzyme maturation permease subunit
VLKDSSSRRSYDDSQTYEEARRTTQHGYSSGFAPAASPTARDVGVFGQCLSALLCLVTGLFLLVLVRFQWMWFLWPLAILAVSVLGFGVLLARSAVVAVNDSLPRTNRLKQHTKLLEIAFWSVIITTGYGLYLVLSD